MPEQVRSAECPSERSERLERLVRCFLKCGNSEAKKNILRRDGQMLVGSTNGTALK